MLFCISNGSFCWESQSFFKLLPAYSISVQCKLLCPSSRHSWVKGNYSAAFCPCLHWCNCKEILNLHQGTWAQNGSARKCRKSHIECLVEKPRKRTPFKSVFYLFLKVGVRLCPFTAQKVPSTSEHYSREQDSNFIQLYGGFQRKCCCYGVFSALYSISRTPVFSVFW